MDPGVKGRPRPRSPGWTWGAPDIPRTETWTRWACVCRYTCQSTPPKRKKGRTNPARFDCGGGSRAAKDRPVARPHYKVTRWYGDQDSSLKDPCELGPLFGRKSMRNLIWNYEKCRLLFKTPPFELQNPLHMGGIHSSRVYNYNIYILMDDTACSQADESAAFPLALPCDRLPPAPAAQALAPALAEERSDAMGQGLTGCRAITVPKSPTLPP